MSIRKLAAQAALVQALFLVAVLGIYFIIMPNWGMQMSDWNSPAKSAKFMVDHKSGWALTYFLDWVFSITTFVLAAAFTQCFSRKQPWLGIMLGGWGVIASAFFFIAGTIGVYGVHIAAMNYAATTSIGLAQTIQQMQFLTEAAGVATVGMVILMAALASSRTKTFAMWVNACGFACGFFYVIGFVLGAFSPLLGYVTMIGIPFAIIFNIGVAMSFMQKDHPELTLATA